jgi:opacity protein-like surface antigen
MLNRLLAGGVMLVSTLAPATALAQSPWVPPRGEVGVSVTYQWLDSDRHLFSDLTEPTLTPFEIARKTDYQSNSLDFGRVQSHATIVDADVGLTDRLAVSGSLAFVAPRYQGAFPHPGVADDGAFRGTVQDLQIGARYMVEKDLWTVTPLTSLTVPTKDYEVLAHAAQGLGLKILETGASVGRILLIDGAARGYLQGTYSYGFTESPDEGVSLNRSRAAFETGFFFGRFAVQGMTTWRRVHGGYEWSEVAFGNSGDFDAHDQSAATREWRYGAGVSIQFTDRTSVEVSYGDLITGANTHDARTIAIGWSWGFQAFGKPTLGGGFR